MQAGFGFDENFYDFDDGEKAAFRELMSRNIREHVTRTAGVRPGRGRSGSRAASARAGGAGVR